jgi:hypothetical protein
VQSCSVCLTQVNDLETTCPNCTADLTEFSQNEVNLKILKSNPRVSRIRLVVAEDACPACQEYEGSYDKDTIPLVPIKGCSHPLGCRCTYKPVLDEIYP